MIANLCGKAVKIILLLVGLCLSLGVSWANEPALDNISITLATETESFEAGIPFSITAAFSEPVEDFAIGSIAVNGVGGKASGLQGRGTSYQFQVTPAALGTVIVSIPAACALGADGKTNQESNILTVSSVEGNDPDLLVHLSFDENRGIRAHDRGLYGYHATLSRWPQPEGGFSLLTHSSSGISGRALHLDGSMAHVSIPPLHLNSNTVTMAAWIRREEGAPMTGSGIIFSSGTDPDAESNDSPCGLMIVNNDELSYCWGNNFITWEWHSGLHVPADKWVHVALVIIPDSGTLYLTEDGETRSANRLQPHPAMPFDRMTRIGTNWGYALFKGDIDEVRIYSKSLREEEISSLAVMPSQSGATAPAAPDTAMARLASNTLRKQSALAGWPYLQSLAGDARADGAEDRAALRFEKVAGPDWLQVAPSGELGGTPKPEDAGDNEFVIRVTDGHGAVSETRVNVEVSISEPIEVTSAVNPFWVEGAVEESALEMVGTLNGSPVRIVRESPTRWFAENTSGAGAPLGVRVPESGDALLTVAARLAGGGSKSVTYRLKKAPIDLSAPARESMAIRQGDALFLTVSGDGEAAEITDGTGGGAWRMLSTSGDGFLQALYESPGVYIASARRAGEEVGALRVDVVETDLSHSGLNLPCDNDKPIAILKGNRREKPVRIFPAAQARNVFFRGNEPDWLGAWLREDVFPSRTCIALEAYALSSTATLSLQARLGGPAGPILDSHPVTAFELKASAETRAPVVKRFDDGSILCWATITMSPFVPGIDMHLHMWGEGGTFGDSTTDIFFSSADFDQDHVFHYDMVWRKMGSLCHSRKTYQDGVMIGK